MPNLKGNEAITFTLKTLLMDTPQSKTMFTKEDHEFVDFLFGKLVKHVDTDMIDLHDDDSCCDHIEFQQLSLLDDHF